MNDFLAKSLRTSLLAGVTAAAFTLSLAEDAQAGAKAFATVITTNAVIYDATGVANAAQALAAPILTNGLEITLVGPPTNTVTASATLNAVTVNTGGIGVTDAPLACVGGGCAGIAQNDFTQQPTPPPFSFSRADALLAGSLINVPPSPPNPAPPASADVVGEVQLLGNESGNAISGIQTTAGFTFTSAIAGPVGVRFDAQPFLEVLLNPTAQAGSATQSAISFSVRITDLTTVGNPDVLDWTPSANLGVIATGVEIADPFNLTQSISTNIPGTTVQRNAALTNFFFAANSLNLTPGNQYSFNIALTSQVQAVKVVPEPGTLALLGTGLLGLGLLYRRRRRHA